MIPDYDKPTNPRWPNFLDGPTARARTLTRMYRARLRALNPAASDEADDVAAGFGETWMLQTERLIEPEQELTTAEAAALVGVSAATVRKWATRDHPTSGGKLLPRFKLRGRERTYLAGHVLEAVALVRRAQLARRQDLP